MSIIPKTFTGTLILAAVALTFVVSILLLLSYRRREVTTSVDHTRSRRIVSWAIIAAATMVPIMVVYPNKSVSMPFLFFVLSGALAALSVVYLALGGQSRMLLAYALLSVSVSLTLSDGLRNNFYPLQNFMQEPLYSTGSLAAYQTVTQQGYYYFIPIGTINSVLFGEFTNMNLGLGLVIDAIELAATLLGLWALFERIGLKFAYPALFFIFSPELSFIDGRTDELVYVAMAFLLVGIASTRSKRSDVLLVLPVITVGVFDHPIAPITIIALFVFLSLAFLLRKGRPIQAHPFLLTALRLALVVTLAYWFLTYIYNLILPHATQTFQSSFTLLTSMFFGSKTALGGGITSALAPGYAEPAFRLFALIWAAPVAYAAAPILVLAIRKVFSLTNKSRTTREPLPVFARNLAVASSLATVVVVGIAYGAYATGTLQGQYLIPSGYFLAIIASAFAFNQLLGSRKMMEIGRAHV